MLAVLFENDQHSREVLSVMLRSLGFTSIRATARFEEFLYLLQQESPVDLILSSQHAKTDGDFSLTKFTAKHPHLAECPLIEISEHWLQGPLSPFVKRQSRVDCILTKPILKRSLKAGLAEAFEHRASKRNTLAFYGTEASARALEEEILSDQKLPWKRVAHLDTPAQMKWLLDGQPSEISAFLIEPDSTIGTIASAIKQYRRSRAGNGVPLAISGQDPALLGSFLTSANLIFPRGESWSRVIELLCRRGIQFWKMNYQIQAIREAIKKNELKLAKDLLKEALRWDEERWELLEISGALYSDPEAFKKSLLTQPCSPNAYLQLSKLTQGSERAQVLEKSKAFCPRHPELMALRS